jgi:hypothetical protein
LAPHGTATAFREKALEKLRSSLIEYPRSDRIGRNLDDVSGNNNEDIGPVIDAIPFLARHGELGVHGADLHLALTQEFL